MRCRQCLYIPTIAIAVIACTVLLHAQSLEKTLTEEQMRDFLLNARVEKHKQIGKGVTMPFRLTLNNGTMVHDASFQYMDEYKPMMQFDNGKREMNFRDSYKYNLAAFELAKLLGLADMMPVTVERKWDGKIGSLSWWLPSKMDEGQRQQKHLTAPDPEVFNKQMHKMVIFSELVYDTDRNLGNILISEDWRLWMIDFSRAFRLFETLQNPKSLVRCDRQLMQKLRQLDAAELEEKTKNWLTKQEINGVMARRDKIVSHFDDLIAKKGEPAVLYDSR